MGNTVTVTTGAYTVNSVNTLRSTNLTNSGSVILQGWYAGSQYGGGNLVYVSTDTTSTDNGCTIFIDSANHRFYRQIPNSGLDVAMCGAKGDGTTDDTTAVQAAINIACASATFGKPPFPVVIPSNFNISITTALSFKGCGGLAFGGLNAVSSSSATPAIKWSGGVSAGPILNLNQANTTTLRNFVVDDTAGPADVVIDDTETGTITVTNTYNEFDDLYIHGPASPDANFVGVRIGQGDIVGNVDVARFDKVTILCANSAPTTNTSNGTGIGFINSTAQPFVTTITHLVLIKCSKGIDAEGQQSVLKIDVGAFTSNYTDLYVNAASGSGMRMQFVRSEGATAPVVVHSVGDLGLKDDIFTLTTGQTGVLITSDAAGLVIIDTVLVSGAGSIGVDATNASGSNSTVIRNSTFTTCPAIATWKGPVYSEMNRPASGSACPNTYFDSSYTVAGSTVAGLPSGTDAHAGEIEQVTDANAPCSAGTTPTGNGTTKCFVGYNGTAWVEFGI